MADEETKPKRKATDNPWYRLATLHGHPSESDDEIAQKNRVIWNRWMVARISDDLKTALREKGWPDDELTPFLEDELRSVEAQVGSPLEADGIDFSDTEFEAPFFGWGFLFPFVDFARAAFSGDANFSNAAFSGDTIFSNAAFSDNAYFASAAFSGNAYFASAAFSVADFGSAAFSDTANFISAAFSRDANFSNAAFSGDTYFASVAFSGDADFSSAAFSDAAYFRSVAFSGDTDFSNAAFSGDADFISAAFSRDANFSNAAFSRDVTFVNAEMRSVTFFTNVKFARPPAFFGAKLHEGTTWRDVTWPVPPKDREQAAEYVEAYERLKLEMDKLKKHGDELDFFARELESRRVRLGNWKGLPIAVYGFLSDYGRSYVRPLLLLAATVLVGTPFFAVHLVGFWTPLLADLPHTRQALGVSFANTFGVFGRPLMKPEVLLELPDWLKAMATIQTILGIVLLFLFGLGIRNRFRMKA